MPFKQPTLDELEARRLAWHEHGDGPGHYRKRCRYEPCSCLYYAERSTSRFCTRQHYENERKRKLYRCGQCDRVFLPYVIMFIGGRFVTMRRKWCTPSCRVSACRQRAKYGDVTHSYPISTVRPRFIHPNAPGGDRRKRKRAGRVMKPIRW